MLERKAGVTVVILQLTALLASGGCGISKPTGDAGSRDTGGSADVSGDVSTDVAVADGAAGRDAAMDQSPDSGGVDAASDRGDLISMIDSAVMDSSRDGAVVDGDGGLTGDSRGTDTGPAEVGSADTASTDTGAADSSSGDTGSADSASTTDTLPADTALADRAVDGVADGGVDGTADGAANPQGPGRVDLGSTTNLAAAGSYVLLAKTGITNVTGSSISGGNVGVSPAAASDVTGFGLIADSTTVFATSASIVSPGKFYASNYATPTPSNLTTAVLSMQGAYEDAAARTNPDFLNFATGQIGGQTLAPGLYRWGTGVTIPNDVTIAGGANDVWIFQIANDVDVSSGKSVILGGSAQARNIFWQVAGQVTIHANAHFEGIILSKTGITLQASASLHGRAYAQSLIAINNNAITAPD